MMRLAQLLKSVQDHLQDVHSFAEGVVTNHDHQSDPDQMAGATLGLQKLLEKNKQISSRFFDLKKELIPVGRVRFWSSRSTFMKGHLLLRYRSQKMRAFCRSPRPR